jgi:hypothetical protein
MGQAMPRRDNQSPEARERERVANRERMARLRQDPEYRARVNAARAARDAERRLVDPELVTRLRANKKRYYDKRKDDEGFWIPRKEYMRRWKEERRAEEEFQAFMDRLEAEENDHQ